MQPESRTAAPEVESLEIHRVESRILTNAAGEEWFWVQHVSINQDAPGFSPQGVIPVVIPGLPDLKLGLRSCKRVKAKIMVSSKTQ